MTCPSWKNSTFTSPALKNTVRRLALAFAFVLVATEAPASAQVRRPIRGAVQGVELTLEGETSVTRGDTLRWWTTSYTVSGLRDLRPASGARISVATALDRQDALDFEADRHGHALIELPIPEDAPDSFGVTLNVSARGVTRRFELSVRTLDPRRIELVAPPQVFAGSTLPVAGTLTTSLGSALRQAEVRVVARDQRGPLGAAIELRTDDRGVFSHALRIPRDAVGAIQVSASSAEDEAGRRVQAAASSSLATSVNAPLILQATPSEPIIRPGIEVPFQLVVRRGDGRPVEGAVVTFGDRPMRSIEDVPPAERDRYALTNARGEATLRLPREQTRRMRGLYHDLPVQFQASATSIGSARATSQVRISAYSHATTLRVEGGALATGMRTQVTAIATATDGQPAGGRNVVLAGDAIGRYEGTTDAHGLVTFDVSLPVGTRDEGCGGSNATAVTLTSPGTIERQLCLAVDVDQSTRGRVVAAAGESLAIEVQRRADVRRLPVLVTLHRVSGNAVSAPLASVLAAPGEDRVELTYLRRQRVLVRTRALDDHRPLRGAFVAYEPLPELGSSTIEVGASREIQASVHHPEVRTTVWFAQPADAPIAPLGLSAQVAIRDRFFQRALRIGAVHPDDGAPYARRGGQVVPLPAPTTPRALLRDPWRARERFVEGRLALIFRAIEARVEASVPGDISEVAAREGSRLRLRDELIASLDASSLGSEGATGLGGEPLTIARLKTLDRTFNYDAVARRITRRRLFGLLLALRDFVRERNFDLPWARPGDPTLWLRPLQGRYVEGFGSVDARALADGWGRAFALRRVSRPRYGRVQPVVGFELVSAGADGRFGTSDDLRNPTARVLGAGSLYGDAVGEDALLARLGGVELGRASASVLAEAFGAVQGPIAFSRGSTNISMNLPSLPQALVDHRFDLALRRPGQPFDLPFASPDANENISATLRTGDEPRTWRVIALSADGRGPFTRLDASVRAGSSILTTGTLPQRLRVGEALERTLYITNVSGSTKRYTFDAQGLEIQLPDSLEVPAGESRPFSAVFTAREAGTQRPSLTIRQDGDVRDLQSTVRVVRGLHPIRRAATGIAPFRTTLRVDEAGAQTRALLLSGRTLALDPDLDEVAHTTPSLVAWSHALSGRDVGETLRARMLRHNASSALDIATGVVAFSSMRAPDGGVDQEALVARQGLVQRLGGVPAFRDRDGAAGQLRALAVSLAALATAGAPSALGRFAGEAVAPRRSDPLDATLLQWRRQLRATLRDQPGEPSLLARASAALLLIDPRDGHGRAMYEAAIDAVVEEGGFSELRPSAERPGRVEALSATLALAIAAHQLGDHERARTLLRGGARYQRAATRRANEATFWWLAAGAYGAFGDAPEQVELAVDGTTRSVPLAEGSAVVDLPSSVRVAHEGEEGLVFLRVESVFAQPFGAQDGPLLTLSLQGTVGRLSGQAGYELEVGAKENVSEPVVDVQLPAGVDIDEQWLARVSASNAVVSAELRRPGFVRLRLSALQQNGSANIALPLPWSSPSAVRGLGAVAYAAAAPEAMTVLAPTDHRPDTN